MSTVTATLIFMARIIFCVLDFFYNKLLSLIYGGASETIPTTKNSVLMESATSLAFRIRTKKVKSVEVVQAFADRINEINGVLNCVVHTRLEEALQEAKKVDELIQSGTKSETELQSETPFLGVPFTTKACIAVKGLPHSAGFFTRKNTTANEDAEVVALMREAGAIPLAITNVSELCFAVESYNTVFGRTKNPYDTNRSAGGSSGGEACLIASSGSPLGIGSDFGGSLRIPCAFNGIFGHKPSAGLCSLGGSFPKLEAPQEFYNAVGPMTRSSADLLPALRIMTKNSKVDLHLEEPVDIKKLKYYFIENDDKSFLGTSVNKEIREAIQKAKDHFKNVHNARTEGVQLEKLKNGLSIWVAQVRGTEPILRKIQFNGKRKLKIVRELIKSLKGSPDHTLSLLFATFIEERLPPHDSDIMEQLRDDCDKLLKELQDLLGTDGVFLYPTQPTAAFYHNETMTKGFNLGYAAVFNALGLPATHCPAGLDSEGLPIGFQVVAGMHQDRLTVAVANEIEKAFGGWKPPPTHGMFTLKKTVLLMSEEKDKLC